MKQGVNQFGQINNLADVPNEMRFSFSTHLLLR